MSKIWRPFGLACLSAACLLITTSLARAGSEPAVRITSAIGQGIVRLNAKANGPFDYVVHHPSTDLYYIDLTGVSASGASVAKVLGNDIVRSYRVEQYDSGDQTVSRIELLTGDGATPKITRQGSDALQITVSKQNVMDADVQDSGEPRIVDAALKNPVSPKPRIRQISVSKNGDVSEVLVLGSGSMNYHELHLSNPARLVLDFQGERISAPKKTESNVDPIRDVRAAQFSPEVARVVIDLSKDSSYAVKHVNGGVAVEFTASEAAASSSQTAAAPLAGDSANSASASNSGAASSAASNSAQAASPANSADASATQTQAAAQPSTPPASADNSTATSAAPASSTDTSSTAQAQTAAQPSASPASDSNSTSSNSPKTTEPTAASSSQAPPVMSQSASQATQSATSQDAKSAAPPAAAPTSAPASQSAAPASETPATQSSQDTQATSQQATAQSAAAAAQNPVPAQAAPAASMMPVPATPANPVAVISQDQSNTKYTGAPISVNLKNVDLQDFFRLVHEISGLNVVVDPSVKGTLTLVLDNVPWDQALDIVLKNNDLDKQLDGNVLRIATKETLRKEAEEERDLAKAQIEAADLVTTTRVLSYAKASDLVNTIKKFLSPRGDVLSDDRTNTLIISDIPTILPVVDNLIRELDTKTQQVEIEARVVAANRSFARELGSQFAFAGSANNGKNLFGGVGAVGTSPVGHIADAPVLPGPPIIVGTSIPAANTPTVVNMPLVTNLATAVPTSGVSYAFSSANFALDYVITAAEAKGVGKLLSKPKEIVQNNQQATIKQGTKIPVQTVINNTISTQFIDAVLELQVTPQITKDGTIFMSIHVENTQIDPAIPRVQGIPALDTQAADTRVLVADGQTVMIGGIIISNQQTTIDEVPFVGSLPIIGQLFRHTTISTNSQELLFFVTPRILPM